MLNQPIIVFLLLLPLYCLVHGKITITRTEVRDWALCNNGVEEIGYREMKCKNYFKKEIPCDDRSIPDEECVALEVRLEGKIDHKGLDIVWKVADEDRSIRKLAFTYDANLAQSFQSLTDTWLTHRLWWMVEREDYLWQKKPTMSLVLYRFRQNYENHLVWLSKVQYPPSEVCDISPFILGKGTCVHPGYAAMIGTYFNRHYYHAYAVLGIYVSTSNRPDESLTFISAADCPNRRNRWECIFLPSTNCTVPDAVTTCNTTNCVQNADFDYYSIANRSGLPVPSPDNSFGATPNTPEQAHWGYYKDVPDMPYLYNTEQPRGDGNVNVFFHLFELRPNLFLRSLIAQMIEEFGKTNNFNFASDRCIAAHVRRGDRNLPEGFTNASEYCKSAAGRSDSDKGCFDVPFASIGLHHIMKKAQTLAGHLRPGIRTVIVATDDYAFVKSEIVRLEKENLMNGWRVLAITPPEEFFDNEQKHDYTFFRSSMGTAGGVHFVGSLELLRHCEGFVGHDGSSVALFLRAMCIKHYKYIGICPPALNLAWGLERRKRRFI